MNQKQNPKRAEKRSIGGTVASQTESRSSPIRKVRSTRLKRKEANHCDLRPLKNSRQEGSLAAIEGRKREVDLRRKRGKRRGGTLIKRKTVGAQARHAVQHWESDGDRNYTRIRNCALKTPKAPDNGFLW